MWANSFELITFVPQKGKSLFCFNKNTKQGFKFLNIMNMNMYMTFKKVEISTTDLVVDNLSTKYHTLYLPLMIQTYLCKHPTRNLILKDL